MHQQNQTAVKEFLLLGLGNLHNFKTLFFIFFLVLYIATLIGNSLVIFLVVTCQSLHFPMYFFLGNLSLSEILFTTNIVPNMLRLVLLGGGTMSVTSCLIQLYLLGVPTVAQCLLLAAMSLDRYLAICHPLHYMSIMTFKLQLQIVTICWLLGFVMSFVIYIFLTRLQFCNSNVIPHFYCDIAPLLELSCSDTFTLSMITSVGSFTIVVSPCFFIIVTYISIFINILKIPTASGRQKTFSTCSSHLTIVCTYYGTLTTIYIVPSNDHSINANRGLSLLYTSVTPLVNPIIYSLRNQSMKRAIHTCVQDFRKWLRVLRYSRNI
ncbi:olfactory receptor 1361-like [Bombina bombina]|uniref:olfactory receptor 1361-like n=1 Tax=Bombina bombina TaxID=8345 RepID=UPI00235B21EA|nr:olfactory receptor 1361-like [Bombina bombina]